MRRGWGRRRGTVALVFAAACALVACTDDSPAEDTSTTTIPEAKTLLRVAAADWPRCIHPLTCAGGAAHDLVFEHVLPTLLEVDADGGYRPSPVLAGEPDSVVDPETGQQTITYRIAEAARWHDGRPITSTDVVGTWHAIMRTPGADRRGYEHIVSIDDTDPLVAIVTLAGPDADWRELFGGYRGVLLQADAFGDDADLTGEFGADLPFGAGPYELVSYDDATIILAAVEDHWSPDRQPEIDQIRIERIDPGVRPPAGVDVWLPEPGSRDTVPGLDRRVLRTTSVLGVWLDQRSPELQDQAVRHALDAVLDRRRLITLVAAPDEDASLVTCLGWLPSDLACGADLVETDSDLAEADALLNAAGWVRGVDGIRVRGGVEMNLPVTYDAVEVRHAAVADAVRLSLSIVGVQVTDTPIDPATWLAPDRVDSTGIGIFAVELGTPGRAAALYDCSTQPTVLRWCDPEVGALAAQVRASTEDEAQRGAAQRLSAAAASAYAWLPLHQTGRSWHVNGDVLIVPQAPPLGAGPLGALYDFVRTDG